MHLEQILLLWMVSTLREGVLADNKVKINYLASQKSSADHHAGFEIGLIEHKPQRRKVLRIKLIELEAWNTDRAAVETRIPHS